MNITYYQRQSDLRPKRGDLLQTNVGDARERTCFILCIKTIPDRWCKQMGIEAKRTKLWAARWWEIESNLRLSLFRSAQRRGGQKTHYFYRFATKSKRVGRPNQWTR